MSLGRDQVSIVFLSFILNNYQSTFPRCRLFDFCVSCATALQYLQNCLERGQATECQLLPQWSGQVWGQGSLSRGPYRCFLSTSGLLIYVQGIGTLGKETSSKVSQQVLTRSRINPALGNSRSFPLGPVCGSHYILFPAQLIISVVLLEATKKQTLRISLFFHQGALAQTTLTTQSGQL